VLSPDALDVPPDPRADPPAAFAADTEGRWVGARLAEVLEAMLLME